MLVRRRIVVYFIFEFCKQSIGGQSLVSDLRVFYDEAENRRKHLTKLSLFSCQ